MLSNQLLFRSIVTAKMIFSSLAIKLQWYFEPVEDKPLKELVTGLLDKKGTGNSNHFKKGGSLKNLIVN